MTVKNSNHYASVVNQNVTNNLMAIQPLVDIHDNENEWVLVADIPGVSRENLTVEVKSNQLLIDGEISYGLSDKSKLTTVSMKANRYRRRFSLSDKIDTSEIKADLINGQLTVKLPKKQEAIARKISVNAA